MRKINNVEKTEKKTKKWACVEISAETKEIVKNTPKTVNQNEFIDSMVRAGLKASGLVK